MTELLFDVATPLGFSVRCTRRQWHLLVTVKHPPLRGREEEVAKVLRDPQVIRRSRKDARVLLFYRRMGTRYLSVVVRTGANGAFLVTAYPTDKMKIGEEVWTRSG